MGAIRYDELKVERSLIKEYQKQLEIDLRRVGGYNDIHRLLLKEFEELFAKYIDAEYTIAVNSGTDALQLSFLALGIGKDDSVIIPDVTYPAVPLSIIYVGAEPIIVDIKKEDLEIDENLIEKKIKKNTKAIIAVHMFSRPCNLEKILEIAKERNLYVIEDCCQAESSEYKGKKLGSFGDLSCFSFSYYKPLSSCGGGGGAICFNNPKYEKIREYTQIHLDSSSVLELNRRFPRMYFLDLVTVKVKFKYLKEIIRYRLKAKNIYEKELEKVKEIKIFKDRKDSTSIPQNYVIFAKQRDKLYSYLRNKGIIAQLPYVPLHLMKVFKNKKGKFPISEKYYREAIQLPLFSFMSAEECRQVIHNIRSFYEYGG